VQWAISGGESKYEYQKTIVGSNCYIGPNVIIAKGVILGNACVVGANSFVNKSFSAGSKIGGNPAFLFPNK
jgi:acetyltransferase-like isoleucine patch superfamily enzyme